MNKNNLVIKVKLGPKDTHIVINYLKLKVTISLELKGFDKGK